MGRVRARTQAFAVRCLPGGWADLARQLLLFCGAYYAYRLVRGLVDGRAAQAFDNAREVIALEQAMRLFVEPAVHAWVVGERWLLDTTGWLYVNSHFTITVVTLAWIYLMRNSAFYYVRNMFMVAMGIALVAYAAFPTAPPRFMPEWGFTDPVAAITGVDAESGVTAVLLNPFAAIPSMHVAFALMIGIPMSRLVRHRAAAAAWLAYPVLVSFVVVATANHWWLDAVLGAATAGLASWAATALVRAQPHAWAFRTVEA